MRIRLGPLYLSLDQHHFSWSWNRLDGSGRHGSAYRWGKWPRMVIREETIIVPAGFEGKLINLD